MYDNDDIMKKIDVLHGETQEEIEKINDKIVDLDKKVDIHIEIAKVMEKNDIASKFTRNQKIAMLAIVAPFILGGLAYIFH